jgi:hypothetical protein
MQVFDQIVEKLLPGTIGIEIFIAQDQSAVVLHRASLSGPEGSCVAQVKVARR